MAKKFAYRGGMEASVARIAFLMMMMTTGITSALRKTEERFAGTVGTAKTVQCTAFLKTTTRLAITHVASMATKSVQKDTVLQIVKTAFWVATEQIVQ